MKTATKTKLSCIIPAYNEESRIAAVIRAVLNQPLIEEILVVNDASTDCTAKVARGIPGVTVLNNQLNRGKSYSLMRGIRSAKNDIVLLLDADLRNLPRNSISALINPVLAGDADISLSLRSNDLFFYDFFFCKTLGVDIFSGERVFNRNLFDGYQQLDRIPRFGFEVFLNRQIIEKKLRVAVVPWEKTIAPRKYSKFGLVQGMLAEFGTIADVFGTVGFFPLLSQFIRMRGLRIGEAPPAPALAAYRNDPLSLEGKEQRRSQA